MELDKLIKRIKDDLEDKMKYKADYCYISVEDVEAIIEYLEQLQVIQENQNRKRGQVVC